MKQLLHVAESLFVNVFHDPQGTCNILLACATWGDIARKHGQLLMRCRPLQSYGQLDDSHSGDMLGRHDYISSGGPEVPPSG